MSTHALLAASPMLDRKIQRKALLEYAMDDVVEAGEVRIGILGEPLIANEPGSGLRQAVRLQSLTDRPLRPDQPVELVLGGSAVQAPRSTCGGGGLRFLVPEVAEPTGLEITLPDLELQTAITLKPQRHWEVHLIHHSHLDIGYTDPQHVVRAQHLGYLDSVLELAGQTEDLDPAAWFRWNEEALFSVTDWLARRGKRQRERFFDLVRRGRISLSAMPFNLHTEMCSTDELHELLRPAAELSRQYGLRFRSAMQTDVPGSVVGLPDALGNVGVEFLSVAHNWAGRSDPDATGALELPRLFRWRGPAGHEVVVWRTDSPHGMAYMEGPINGFHESYRVVEQLFPAYLSSLAKRPYPLPPGSVFGWIDINEGQLNRQPYPWDLLHLRVHGRWSDNAGPARSVSDIVAKWNDRWAYPRLRVSTNEDFLDAAVARVGDQLQTYTGDWNDWWAHGVGAAVAPVAVGRRAQYELADAQTLAASHRMIAQTGGSEPVVDPARGYRQLALWDEHTWGAANSWEYAEEGASSGAHQWAWKVARSYDALDEAEQSMQQAGAELAGLHTRPRDVDLCLYVYNTGGQRRSEPVEVFLPQSVAPLPQGLRLIDARTGAKLPHTERVEPANSRALGRYLRFAAADVPAVGFIRIDVELDHPDSATPADPSEQRAQSVVASANMRALDADDVLENNWLRIRFDHRRGTVSSIMHRSTGREIVNADSAVGFNSYVYDRYSTVGRSNHNSSKFADTGSLALISSRQSNGAAAVVEAVSDEVEQRIVVERSAPGAELLHTTYRLRHDDCRLEIVNRLRKPRTWDKESAFFGFPFKAEDPKVMTESAGGLAGPDADRVPGGATYLHTIRSWVAIQDDGIGIGWASADVPLVQIGTIALPYLPFPNTMTGTEPATVFSWVHNNIWDTNFPVEQSFDLELRYAIGVGAVSAAEIAADTAAMLTQPLRALIVSSPADTTPPEAGSLLEIINRRVRLVGLCQQNPETILARMISVSPDAEHTPIRLPRTATAVAACSYLGQAYEELTIQDGSVNITLPAGATAALLITLS